MATILNIQSLKLEGEAKVLVKYNIKSNFCVLQYWIWILLPPFLYILQHFLPLYERQYLIGSNNVKNRRETKRQFCMVHENYWHFQGWPNGKSFELEETHWIEYVYLADTQKSSLHLGCNFICSLSELHFGFSMKQYGSNQQNNAFEYIFLKS